MSKIAVSRQLLIGVSLFSLFGLITPPSAVSADSSAVAKSDKKKEKSDEKKAKSDAKKAKSAEDKKVKASKTDKSDSKSSKSDDSELAKTVQTESVQTDSAQTESVHTESEQTESEQKSSKSESKSFKNGAVPPRITSELDAKTFQLVNQGNWKAAAARLETITQKSNLPTRNHAWLAFAYMFLNQCDDLKKLSSRIDLNKPSEKLSAYVVVIDAFKDVCDGKPDLANETLKKLPTSHVNDSFINFALAAVAGKQGKAGAAAEHCKRAVELDPEFAWGFRTLGYLQSRWLNQPQEAEKAFTEAVRLEPAQGEVREMLINERLTRNDFDGAIDLAMAGVTANKKDGKSHYRLSQIYVQQWRLREALTELEQAIETDPDTAIYYRTRATIRKYQGNFADAIADQKKAVDLSKDKPFELVELANMYSQNGNSSEAIASLNEALKLDPTNSGAQKSLITLLGKEKRFDALIDAYKNAIKSQPKDGGLHYSLAETLHALGEDDEAILEYKEAANLDQKHARPHRKIGAIYSAKRDFEKAEEAFRRALNINPGSVQDLVALGFCYAQRENYLQAEAGFVTALALQQLMGSTNPDDPKREDIIRSLASLLIVEGRYGDARAQFESLYGMTRETDKGAGDKYLVQQSRLLSDRSDKSANELIEGFKTLPETTQAGFRYTLVQTLLKAGKADLALNQIGDLSDEQLAEDPRWGSLRARALRLKGSFPEAKVEIEKAIEAASKLGEGKEVLVAEMLLEKARILNDSGSLKDAEESAGQALAKYDKIYASYLVLGQVKLKQNDSTTALELAKKALEQNPYFTDAYILSGDAYLKLGKPKDAVENYKKATEIYPGLVNAQKALLRGYKALALNDEVAKLQQQIDQMEKVQ
ncbi:MAG: tetratricopeptide repeat protein [Candidatus Melainabacteria bacterium]|nr:tetratricopeptide repeat protein [Candidatus Melainabacteria bacterium]